MHKKDYHRSLVALSALISLVFCGQCLAADVVVTPIVGPPDLILAPDAEVACPDYLEIASKIVPQTIGDPRYVQTLISVEDGRDWMANFPEDCMNVALGDRSLKPVETSEPLVGMCASEISALRYNKAAGEFKYYNRTRAFDPEKSPLKAVGEDEGIKSLIPMLVKINMPLEEGDWESWKEQPSIVLMGAIGDVRSERPATFNFDVERHYRFTRAIRGVPVLNSKFFAAVSNLAEVSKTRIRWPQFMIDPRLKQEKVQALSREAVVGATYQALLAASPECASLESFHAYVGYVPLTQDPTPDGEGVQSGEPTEGGIHLERVVYEPKLVVGILTKSQEEGGEEILVDILTVEGTNASDDER
jgi:hypothetical protein